jgi:hypothetical protein
MSRSLWVTAVLGASIAVCFESLPLLEAATQAQIDQAVGRGVQYLLSTQSADGSWNYGGYIEGATALAGLALLESGVRPKEPAIERSAQFIRSRANSCTQTYSLALIIFFLDRLGDRGDEPLIVTLGERLRNGQNANGAWTYTCRVAAAPVQGGLPGGGDNSNTQFAILGLWVARRHGVDVKAALERTDQYFRGSQAQDGGWNYISAMSGLPGFGRLGAAGVPGISTSTGSMTCAGLLGLLVQIGNQAALRAGEAKDLKAGPRAKTNSPKVDPLQDPAVQAGLKCLEQFLMPQGAGMRLGLGTELYFLWSVERVGMAYGLKKIGAIDWYAMGADRILAMQQAGGSWSDYSPNVGTSLALLFLKRTNVASDLTRLVGGEGELRSGRDVEDLKTAAQAPSATAGRPVQARSLTAEDIGAMSPEQLKAALPGLDAKQQAAVLQALRDRKGAEATVALADAIATLDEPSAAQARQLLAERLERMTPATLARYLEYQDDEIRQAAARAAGSKQDRSLTQPLIELLDERNTAVADAAHAALVELTGQQFGPFAGQATANRFAVSQRWKAWWKQQAQRK